MGLISNPNIDADNKDPDRTVLDKYQGWYTQSESLRSKYDDRWVKNMRLIKGQFPEDETTRSKVRKRAKIFYRKTWATGIRLVAAFYTAFIRDRDIFKIEGRDTLKDPARAKVLHNMTEYRKDVMMRTQSLFLQFIWAFQNIVNLGWATGKMRWEYNPEYGKDGPVFKLYPNEQVFPDLTASLKEERRYVIFEDYLTREDMEELGYENIDKAEATAIPSNIVRQARYAGERDPLQDPSENEYPSAGRYSGENIKDAIYKLYRVWEIFYKEKGKIMFTVTNQNTCVLKEVVDSPYGDRYPDVSGVCLTEAHKLIGEGFPEPLEGPQESLNANLNQRKDNVALALNKGYIVSRYGNVDLKSLVNSRPGGITLADDPAAVQPKEIGDVTQSSYVEAAADEGMMQEMSGITPQKLGMGKESKATVAQINYAESNAKIDLYIAIVGETWVQDFFSLLAYYIQRFETDERVFRIANDTLRQDTPEAEEVYDLDFEADCIVNVGLGAVSRDMEIKNTLLVMDRAIMSNQAIAGLAQVQLIPPEGVRLFDCTTFMEDMLPKLGKKEIDRYFFKVPAPPPPQQGPGGRGGGQGGAAIAGKAAAQMGQTGQLTGAESQMGTFGGI